MEHGMWWELRGRGRGDSWCSDGRCVPAFTPTLRCARSQPPDPADGDGAAEEAGLRRRRSEAGRAACSRPGPVLLLVLVLSGFEKLDFGKLLNLFLAG